MSAFAHEFYVGGIVWFGMNASRHCHVVKCSIPGQKLEETALLEQIGIKIRSQVVLVCATVMTTFPFLCPVST